MFMTETPKNIKMDFEERKTDEYGNLELPPIITAFDLDELERHERVLFLQEFFE